jgi:hypothetical protein
MPQRDSATALERKRARGLDREPPEIETLIGRDDTGGIARSFGSSARPTNPPHLSRISSERLLPLSEAAANARLSVRTLARYRRNGSLEVVKVGRRVFCSLEAIHRATVRRSLQQLWREVLDPARRGEPLAPWLADLEALAIANPSYEHPDVQRQLTEAVLAAFPSLRVRELTVGHLRVVAGAMGRSGAQIQSIRLLCVASDDTPVWEALGALHRRFGA